MVLFWFLLAVVLLVAALVLLRLDARQRGGGASPKRGLPVPADRTDTADDGNGNGDGDGDGDDLDRAPAGTDDDDDKTLTSNDGDSGPVEGTDDSSARGFYPVGDATETSADHATAVTARVMAGAPVPAPFQRGGESGRSADQQAEQDIHGANDAPDDTSTTDDPHDAGGSAVHGAAIGAGAVGAAAAAGAASSPSLRDRVRSGLSGLRSGKGSGRTGTDGSTEPAPTVGGDSSAGDALADSPVVRWLEEREFEPTPTPAPDFQHGDFASGLPALGTVSHGVFRGRRAIMGVTGGRTVLALRRDTSSDVILDLSREDVPAEPGFHDAGEVASLEARTSDVGRLGLVDTDRLAAALRDLPAELRRVWAEDEWVAATLDGTEDPRGWDDAVVALDGAADVLSTLPPIGGRARPLPADIDPGAPGAASGPGADPATGMDGDTGDRSGGAGDRTAGSGGPGDRADETPATARTAAMPAVTGGADDDEAVAPDATSHGDDADRTDSAAGIGAAGAAAGVAAGTAAGGAAPKRAGHLRLVRERGAGVKDLTGEKVTADRGDRQASPETDTAESTKGDSPTTDPADASKADDQTTAAPTTDTADATKSDESTVAEPTVAEESAADEPAAEEPDPFADVMEPAGPIASRGDVAADHLEPRPPLARPSRGAGQSYPEDASVPPLAAGANSGDTGIKPIGSEDDEDEIRNEVERFDAARIDGGSDLDTADTGRHGSHGVLGDASPEETGALSVAELAARLGATPRTGRRHRRREDDAQTDTEQTDTGARGGHRERPGIDPDVEQTANLRLPPDIRD